MKKYVISLIIFIAVSRGGNAFQPAVVSANAQASQIGLNVLKKGGSAADAAIATAFALSVVEPHHSGIGGGGFLLYYQASDKTFWFVDYREIAPLATQAAIYQKNPKKLQEGILSVALPGFLKGMESIHQKWGKLSWEDLIDPSIQLAKNGFPIKGLLEQKIEKTRDLLKQDPELEKIFLTPMEQGKNKIIWEDLSLTLHYIKNQGARVFYQGELGKKLVGFMRQKGGLLRKTDLVNYRVLFRTPHVFKYGALQIISSPLPSSGGMGLDLLFKKSIIYGLDREVPYSIRAYKIMLQSMKDYFDYRDIALGDTPANILTSHTTHLNVMDALGNMAAMTNTLNSPFGAGLVIPGTGIILNNEMDDFSKNSNSANRIQPGARPLSSMAPTFVFEKETPKIILGTPGGTTIPQNIYQILYPVWKWQIPLSKAIQHPKIYYSPKTQEVFVENKIQKKAIKILQKENVLRFEPSVGNVQALILKSQNKTIPLSDPRGEGRGFVLN